MKKEISPVVMIVVIAVVLVAIAGAYVKFGTRSSINPNAKRREGAPPPMPMPKHDGPGPGSLPWGVPTENSNNSGAGTAR